MESLSPTSRAGRWFLSSGIQSCSGGVARYYLTDKARNLPISTEITGYAASALAYLYTRTGEAEYLEAGSRAAAFLTQAFDPSSQLFPFELPQSGVQTYSYFFDCGIIIRALIAVYRLTHNPDLLDVAVTAGRAMHAHFPAPTGFHPVLLLPELTPAPYESRWSREPGCFQLKAALAWRDLYDETDEHEYLDWYNAAAEMLLATHDSFLPGSARREDVMDRLHAYSYFLEALLPRAGEPAVNAALAKGIGRVAFYLRDIGPEFERSDVAGQLLRVRLWADAAGAIPIDDAAARWEASRLLAYQLDSPDPRLHNGFCFGSRKGQLLPYVNPVSAAFCLQALDMRDRFEAGEKLPSWRALI